MEQWVFSFKNGNISDQEKLTNRSTDRQLLQIPGILSRGIFHETCGGEIEPLVIYEDLANYRDWIESYTNQTLEPRQTAVRVNAAQSRLDSPFGLNLFGSSNATTKKPAAKCLMLILCYFIAYYYVI